MVKYSPLFFSLLLSTNLIAQVEDITPPLLVGFSFTPITVDTSTQGQSVTVTTRTTDNLSGFRQGSYIFVSPSGKQSVGSGLGTRILGNAFDGVYQSVVDFPKFSEVGTWHVNQVTVEDLVGNGLVLFENDLIALGFPTKLQIGPPTNQPPIAKCQDLRVAAGSSCTAPASINNGSYDPDGDPITLIQSPAGPYPEGNTRVTLTVTDNKGVSSQCTGTVTVVDTTPPTITNASAKPSALWPPNHKMVDVIINYMPTDNCDQPVCKISRVTSNESISSSDYTIVNSYYVKLLAERDGNGTGRVYTITITCNDNSGNSSEQTVEVTVPHDQGTNKGHVLSINQGAPFTNKADVTLFLDAEPSTSQMMVSNDGGFAGAVWEPYNSQKQWQITQYGDQAIPRVVYALFKNSKNVPTSTYIDFIILDTTPPHGGIKIVTTPNLISNNPEERFISDEGFKIFLPLVIKPLLGGTVQLDLSAIDEVSGVGQMMISNQADFPGGVWEPFNTQKDWEMTGSTVYVKFMDNAGNISEVYSASKP